MCVQRTRRRVRERFHRFTPEWMLWSNLKFPCGNVCGISSLQSHDAKYMVFSGSYAGTTVKSSG